MLMGRTNAVVIVVFCFAKMLRPKILSVMITFIVLVSRISFVIKGPKTVLIGTNLVALSLEDLLGQLATEYSFHLSRVQ